MGLIKGGFQLGALAVAGHYASKAIKEHDQHKYGAQSNIPPAPARDGSYDYNASPSPPYEYRNASSSSDFAQQHQPWCNGVCLGQWMGRQQRIAGASQDRGLDSARRSQPPVYEESERPRKS